LAQENPKSSVFGEQETALDKTEIWQSLLQVMNFQIKGLDPQTIKY
jgi:hypothetical protein